MKAVFIAPSTLYYKDGKYKQGDEVEITEEFYNNHKGRFNVIDDGIIEAEFTEIKNVIPNETTSKKSKKNKKSK